MIERGNYRSIHCALVDGPDFQAFSPGAKLVFYTLKMTLGPSGIDVVPALVATLVERTGSKGENIEKALIELDTAGWVKRERNVVWIVDGLRYDPALTLTNPNHRSKVAKHVNGLPRLALVDAFRAHYGLSTPPAEIPSSAPEKPADGATEIPPMMPPKGASTDHLGSGRGKGKREKGRGNTDISASDAAEGGNGRGSVGRPTWLTPFDELWLAKYGGHMAAGKAVKSLRRLVDTQGAEETLRRWAIYIAATAAEYANAPKFAETWGRWEQVQVTTTIGSFGRSSANAQEFAAAATDWDLIKSNNLLTAWPLAELHTIADRLVSERRFPDREAFLGWYRMLKPVELREARTDKWAVEQIVEKRAVRHGAAS